MYWHVTTRNSQKCCSTYWVYDIVCVYIKHKATINLNRFVASLNLWICFYMVRVVLALRPYIVKCASSHQHHINAKITNSSSSKNIEEKKILKKQENWNEQTNRILRIPLWSMPDILINELQNHEQKKCNKCVLVWFKSKTHSQNKKLFKGISCYDTCFFMNNLIN